MISEKSANPGQRYKIILVGDCHVGKTSIFWRYIHGQSTLEHPLTTIDYRYKTISLHQREVKLCIWDTAGQEKFRSIVATYFKSCEGVVMVLDMSDASSWQSVKNVWYQMAFKRVPNASYLLLGNKKDKVKLVPLEEIHRWCKSKGIYFIQTCAVTGEAIEQAFFTLAALIDSKQEHQSTHSHSLTTSYYYNSQTTKEESQRASVVALQKQKSVRGQSFFLKKSQKVKKKEKCCR